MAGFLTITIEKGEDYGQVLQYKERETPDQCTGDATPVDIQGWQAKMQVRRTAASPVIFELTHLNGGIDIEPAPDGKFTINISAVQSLLLVEKYYSYDLLFTRPDNQIIKVLYGTIIVNQLITQ
jgi:hypothetical protein